MDWQRQDIIFSLNSQVKLYKCFIIIILLNYNFLFFLFLGWDRLSIGYHGDDGNIFHKTGEDKFVSTETKFGEGDTVGAGIIYPDLEQDEAFRIATIFFTLNGKLVRSISYKECDYIFKHLPVYPVIGTNSSRLIHINTGQTPFKFDVFTFENHLWKMENLLENCTNQKRQNYIDYFLKFNIKEENFFNFINIRNENVKKVEEVYIKQRKKLSHIFSIKNNFVEEKEADDSENKEDNIYFEKEDSPYEDDEIGRELERKYIFSGMKFSKIEVQATALENTILKSSNLELLEIFRMAKNLNIRNKNYEKTLLSSSSTNSLSSTLSSLFYLNGLNNVLKTSDYPKRFTSNLQSNYYQKNNNNNFPTYFNMNSILKSYIIFVSLFFIIFILINKFLY